MLLKVQRRLDVCLFDKLDTRQLIGWCSVLTRSVRSQKDHIIDVSP